MDVCFRKTEKIQVGISILDKVKSELNFESSRISINSTASEKFNTSLKIFLIFLLILLHHLDFQKRKNLNWYRI